MIDASAVVLHVARCPLGAGDDAEEVDVHDAGEVGEVVWQESFELAADAGVVEHDVQTAEAVDGVVDQRLNLVCVAHIGLLEGDRFADFSGHLLAVVHVDVGDHDLRSLRHE